MQRSIYWIYKNDEIQRSRFGVKVTKFRISDEVIKTYRRFNRKLKAYSRRCVCDKTCRDLL